MNKFFAMTAVLAGLSFAQADHPTQVGQPMVEAAQDFLSKGTVLLDVRQEACDGYVKGAHIISIDEFSKNPQKAVSEVSKLVNNDKSKSIAIYCRSGVRAGRALNILKENGFTNVHNLGGVGDYYNVTSMEKCK